MKSCCLGSIKKYIKKPRDLATCDTCACLLLSYSSEVAFKETMKALRSQGTSFEFGMFNQIPVIAKPRLIKK